MGANDLNPINHFMTSYKSLIDCKVGDNNDLHQRKFLVTITNCYNEIHRLYQVPKGVVPNGLRVNCSQCKGLLV